MSRFDNGVVQLYQGDARQVLRELPAESVHCVVTSPPYWGLRDYGLEPPVWDGDEGHAHEWGEESYQRRSNDGGKTPMQASNAGANGRDEPVLHAFCACGAWRGSLGLEPSIDLYVEHVVEVFREVWRVLRKNGTLWLTMGDSYAHTGASGGSSPDGPRAPRAQDRHAQEMMKYRVPDGLKPKDLCMMPARVALALQADGWWLRSDIVWSKPNPMPESVTDRPTRSHEYLFLLTKAARYYYDADAIREPFAPSSIARISQATFNSQTGGPKDPRNGGEGSRNRSARQGLENLKERWDRKPSGWNSAHDESDLKGRIPQGDGYDKGVGANNRSVWEIATEPYPEAHFATFPQKLVEPCVLAGCPTEGTVLDPFAGSGTVAYVAQRLGRRSIGIDLSAEYLALAETRLAGLALPMRLGVE